MLSCLVLSCLVLSCLVLSCLVLSCLVLSCLVWSGLVWSGLVWSGLVWSYLVLSCLVLSSLILFCLLLSCVTFIASCAWLMSEVKAPAFPSATRILWFLSFSVSSSFDTYFPSNFRTRQVVKDSLGGKERKVTLPKLVLRQFPNAREARRQGQRSVY